MIPWIEVLGAAAFAIAAGLPAALRGLALWRAARHSFETHGAANDPRY